MAPTTQESLFNNVDEVPWPQNSRGRISDEVQGIIDVFLHPCSGHGAGPDRQCGAWGSGKASRLWPVHSVDGRTVDVTADVSYARAGWIMDGRGGGREKSLGG